jgi:hypothetical protein
MAEASFAGLRQVSCRSTDTSISACDVANARLHGKGKCSNGILFPLERKRQPALGVVIMRHGLDRCKC